MRTNGMGTCAASMIFGAIGGVLAFLLHCCCLCTRRSREHARWMLPEPDTAVTRVVARVVGHHKDTGRAPEGHMTTTCYVQVHLAAVRSGGATFNVSGQKTVPEKSYDVAAATGQLQVAYPIHDERSFEVVSDLENSTRFTSTTVCLLALPTLCAGIGLALVASTVPNVGCYEGFAPLIALILAGVLAGQFCIWPLMRCAKAAIVPVTVLPVNASAACVLGAPA